MTENAFLVFVDTVLHGFVLQLSYVSIFKGFATEWTVVESGVLFALFALCSVSRSSACLVRTQKVAVLATTTTIKPLYLAPSSTKLYYGELGKTHSGAGRKIQVSDSRAWNRQNFFHQDELVLSGVLKEVKCDAKNFSSVRPTSYWGKLEYQSSRTVGDRYDHHP